MVDFPQVQITVVKAIVRVAHGLTADAPDTTDYPVLGALAATLALLRIIHEADPDIILAVETDQWWKEKLGELEKTYAFTVLQPQINTYGMLLYSSLELLAPEVKFLVQDERPVSGHQRPARSAHRPQFLQQLPRTTAFRAIPARSLLSFELFQVDRVQAPSLFRLGSLSGLHRPQP